MQSFFSLIDYLNRASPEERPLLEKIIWSTYGVEKAIMTLDMSNFSLSVRRSGILHYLGMIRHMQVLSCPLVEAHGGEVIKYVADNLMAVFENTRDAIDAAVRLNQALQASPLPSGADDLTVSIGIDYGRFLLLSGQDCYGDAVNIAYKLGEDLARPGEILISPAAREQLGDDQGYPLEEQRVSISGLDIVVYSVRYPAAA